MTSLHGYHLAVDALIALGVETGVDLAAHATNIYRGGTHKGSGDYWSVSVHSLSAADFNVLSEFIDAGAIVRDETLFSDVGTWADMQWTLHSNDIAPCTACGDPATHEDADHGRLCTPHAAAATRAHDEHVEASR